MVRLHWLHIYSNWLKMHEAVTVDVFDEKRHGSNPKFPSPVWPNNVSITGVLCVLNAALSQRLCSCFSLQPCTQGIISGTKLCNFWPTCLPTTQLCHCSWLGKIQVVKELLVDQSEKARPELDALAYAYIYLQVMSLDDHITIHGWCFGCSCQYW